MNNRPDEAVVPASDAELDLRGVIRPYNFVKTKLKLETMEKGQVSRCYWMPEIRSEMFR